MCWRQFFGVGRPFGSLATPGLHLVFFHFVVETSVSELQSLVVWLPLFGSLVLGLSLIQALLVLHPLGPELLLEQPLVLGSLETGLRLGLMDLAVSVGPGSY